MDDEDVFDSVTWETPSNPYAPASTPGYKPYSATDDERDQTEPKWEGYLLTSVRDPVKELAETKDAYVSYLVQAKVCALSIDKSELTQRRPIFPYSPVHIPLHVDVSKTLSSCEHIYLLTFPHALFLLSPTSIV